MVLGLTTSAIGSSAEIIAHRGESALAPENTLASVELAWKLGADAVEVDCYLTADGKIIISHDKDTKRTSGKKLLIVETKLSELRKLDAGKWKGQQWAGQKMPLLDEVLATIPDGKRLFLEIKVGPEAVPEIKRIFDASKKKPEQIVFISYSAPAVAECKRLMPKCEAALIYTFKQDKTTGLWNGPTADEVIKGAKDVKADGADLNAKPPVDREFVEKLKKAGLKVYVWTVDSPSDARRLIDYGVLGVTTNKADYMKKALASGDDQVEGSHFFDPDNCPGGKKIFRRANRR